MGDQQAAENWLVTLAMALEQRRPVDLLATPAGIKLVEDLLVRMDYGVYACAVARRAERQGLHCRATRSIEAPLSHYTSPEQ